MVSSENSDQQMISNGHSMDRNSQAVVSSIYLERDSYSSVYREGAVVSFTIIIQAPHAQDSNINR